MSCWCVICPHAASWHNRPTERIGEQEHGSKESFWRAATRHIYFPEEEIKIGGGGSGPQTAPVFSFNISIFARVRRSARRAKIHRNTFKIMSDGIKDKHFVTKVVLILMQHTLGGGVRGTVGLLMAVITLNQMFWHQVGVKTGAKYNWWRDVTTGWKRLIALWNWNLKSCVNLDKIWVMGAVFPTYNTDLTNGEERGWGAKWKIRVQNESHRDKETKREKKNRSWTFFMEYGSPSVLCSTDLGSFLILHFPEDSFISHNIKTTHTWHE